MRQLNTKKKLSCLAVLLAFAAYPAAFASEADHHEFEATLHAPYTGEAGKEARTFSLNFEYPHLKQAHNITWTLELVDPQGQVVHTWNGAEHLFKQPVDVAIKWNGSVEGRILTDGLYKVRMKATAAPVKPAEGADAHVESVEQEWEVAIGQVAKPVMPRFAAMPTGGALVSGGEKKQSAKDSGGIRMAAAPATASLPYTVYFGNLHSQTNHSDGGGTIGACSGAHAPQSGTYGPADAFTYAKNKGLDFLLASEHNHMYDGSDSTNTAANPATAKALYQSGLSAAANFNAANPNFLAIYGMEWGVINNGGHLNILNSNELLGWELNSSGQVIGDTLTVKNDYAALYTLMRQRGWLGQFNHPSSSGQFLVNGVPLGYTADGDEAMALCEVMNTSAFSNNTTETETGRSTYEGACNKALEAGFHIAFVTNQDNHCANWGASYTNRTGVLIPSGTALSTTAFMDAIRARRVFATMDKTSQLVLTGNGKVMGERFTNSGALNLVANFASTSGKTVSSVVIYEGVPGRNGTVTQLSTAANTTITPSVGEHFYYAKVTQNDGNILWSAPIWVTQTAGGGDTTAPVVSASESGTSGTITLSANASDNVGVTNVEFYVDGVLKASSNVAPYSATLNSTTLSNGSHSLVARAYDAAGNSTNSTPVSFSINNPVADTIAPTVTASESGTSGTITLSASASDNVGVTKVEFYVDNVLKGTDTTSPFSMTMDSKTLTNASHALTAKAFDAAGNSKLSTAVNFTINNPVTPVQLVLNGGFESGSSSWTATSGVITNDSSMAARTGSYKAWMNGYGSAHTDSLYQTITIPSSATSATLSFWLKVVSDETTTTSAYDTLKVQVRNTSNGVLSTLATYSNLNKGSSFVQRSFSLLPWKGQTVRIYFEGIEGSTVATSFVLDDISATAQ